MRYSSKLVRMGPAANFFFVLVSLFPPCLTAQFGSAPALVPLTSITGLTCVSGYSRSLSPGLSAWDTAWRVSVMTSPSPFGLVDLQTHTATASGAVSSDIGVALTAEAFGGSLYRETDFAASASARVSPHASIGAAISYASMSIVSDRSISAVRCDLGANLQVSSQSRVTIAFHNIGRSGVREFASTIPQDVVVAYGTRIDDDLAVEALYAVVLQRSHSFQCAVSQRIASVITLRLAADVTSTLLGADVAVDIGASVRIFGFMHMHPVLGLRSGGGVSWSG